MRVLSVAVVSPLDLFFFASFVQKICNLFIEISGWTLHFARILPGVFTGLNRWEDLWNLFILSHPFSERARPSMATSTQRQTALKEKCSAVAPRRRRREKFQLAMMALSSNIRKFRVGTQERGRVWWAFRAMYVPRNRLTAAYVPTYPAVQIQPCVALHR